MVIRAFGLLSEFLALVIIIGNLANADKCEKRLSLDSFRAYALNKSPVVATIDRDYANELAKAIEVEVLSNPELQIEKTYTRMKIGGSNDPQINLSLGQPIRISNFGSKKKVSQLIRKAGDSTRKFQILEASQKFIIQYYTLYALRKSQIILSEAASRAAKKVALIRQGVGKGLLSIGDQRLFEGEQYRLEAQGKGLIAQVSELQSQIGTMIGLPCAVIPDMKESKIEIPSEEELIAMAQASSLSEIARLDLLHNLAYEQAKLAELDAYPQITPRILYQHTNDGGDFFGAGISVPLNFWNRNNSERARAAAERSLVQRRQEYIVTGGLDSQIRSLRLASLSAKEQAEIYTEKVVPAFGAALDAQERLYSEGKANVLQVWETLKTYNQVRMDSLTHWLDAVSMRVHLSVLVGEEL